MRKKLREAQSPKQRRIKVLDEVLNHCENIEALGSLLAHYDASEGVHEGTVNHSGHIILAETQRLRALLRAVGEPRAQRA